MALDAICALQVRNPQEFPPHSKLTLAATDYYIHLAAPSRSAAIVL